MPTRRSLDSRSVPAEPTAAEANRIFYRDEARAYDQTEDCLCEARNRERLQVVLAAALARLDPAPRVLDACGGTGNVGVALHARGITPVVVDVSPDMTAIWSDKAADLGLSPEIHNMAIEEFLSSDGRRWDLITFTSALHHLEDYTNVLLLAAARLAPGGLLLTLFDPTPATREMRLVRKLDFVLWLVLKRPTRFVRLVGAAVQRKLRPAGGNDHVGRLAERYAYTGIDDFELARASQRSGLELVVHERTHDARLAAVRHLLRLLGWPSSFHLLLRRPR